LVHADRGPLRAQDDCYSGILDNDVSRDSLLGDEFECAVLEVLYVMLSSSRNVALGSAARTSFISEKVSAVSDSMPNPPAWARPECCQTACRP